MLGILERYVGRTVLMAILLATLTLVGLSALIKFVEQLKQVGQGQYDVWAAAWYVLLSTPKELVMFFPMGALLGGVVGLGQLASTSELVVLQATGRSRFNIVMAVLKTAIPVMILISLVGEYLAPITEQKARDMKTMAISNGQMAASTYGVWAREGQDFINIGTVFRDGRLGDLTFYRFDRGQQLLEVAKASEATYVDGVWRLRKVYHTRFDNREQVRTDYLEEDLWRSRLSPKKLGVVAVSPDDLSAKGLYDYVNYMKSNGQNVDRYELELWRKLLSPLAVIAMMLLAASTVFGPLRSVSMGARIVLGVIIGFGFYVTNQVFGPISLVYAVPPVLGALMPSLLFLGVAGYLLRRRT